MEPLIVSDLPTGWEMANSPDHLSRISQDPENRGIFLATSTFDQMGGMLEYLCQDRFIHSNNPPLNS